LICRFEVARICGNPLELRKPWKLACLRLEQRLETGCGQDKRCLRVGKDCGNPREALLEELGVWGGDGNRGDLRIYASEKAADKIQAGWENQNRSLPNRSAFLQGRRNRPRLCIQPGEGQLSFLGLTVQKEGECTLISLPVSSCPQEIYERIVLSLRERYGNRIVHMTPLPVPLDLRRAWLPP